MKRLTWLVGPPGAGKSTWAKTQVSSTRVVELNDMLAPLLQPAGISKGVLRANGQLVQLIRDIELSADNISLGPLLVVAGMVPEEILFAGGQHEEVWLMLPSRERWELQLRSRPKGRGSRKQYTDYEYAESWYERFESWSSMGRPVVLIDAPYRADLIGKTCR